MFRGPVLFPDSPSVDRRLQTAESLEPPGQHGSHRCSQGAQSRKLDSSREEWEVKVYCGSEKKYENSRVQLTELLKIYKKKASWDTWHKNFHFL